MKPPEISEWQLIQGLPLVAELTASSPLKLPPYPGGRVAYQTLCPQIVRRLREDPALLKKLSHWVRDDYNVTERYAVYLVFYASDRYFLQVKKSAGKGQVVLDSSRKQPHLRLTDQGQKLKIEITAEHQRGLAAAIEKDLKRDGWAETPGEQGLTICDQLAERAATHLVLTANANAAKFETEDLAREILDTPQDIASAFLEGDDYDPFSSEHLYYWVFSSVDRNVQILAQHALTKTSAGYLEVFLRIRNEGTAFARDGYVTTCSSAEFRSIQRTLTLNSFELDPRQDLPCDTISAGKNRGNVFLKKTEEGLDPIWKPKRRLDAEDADTMDMLMVVYLHRARDPREPVCVDIDELLRMRGLKEKNPGGGGRRHGFSQKQRRKMLESIQRVETLWIDMISIKIVEEKTRKASSIASRAFEVTDRHTVGKRVKAIVFLPGKVFSIFLFDKGRQLLPISEKVIQYHQTRQVWEKLLGRYFAGLWRIRSNKTNTPLRLKLEVATLFRQVGMATALKRPGRAKERLEKTLDTLQTDKIIEKWEYVRREPSMVGHRNFSESFPTWLVAIDPPPFVREHYRSAGKVRRLP